MGSSLPELFGRHFIIGHLTPASIFTLSIYGLLQGFDIDAATIFTRFGKAWDIVGFSILLSIFSLITNYSYIQFLEGYGSYNPLKLFLKKKIETFNEIKSRVNKTKEEVDSKGGIWGEETPEELISEYSRLGREFAEFFPSEESKVLPTRFGNIIAAFESYPRDMYGFEPVHGWLRLLSIVNKDYVEELDGAKAIVDYWVNISFYIFIFLITFIIIFTAPLTMSEYITDIQMDYIFSFIVITVLLLLLIFRSIWQAGRAAKLWGEVVKSAVDVNLGELQKKLRFQEPKSGDVAHVWGPYGLAVNLRDPALMPKKIANSSLVDRTNKLRYCQRCARLKRTVRFNKSHHPSP